MNIMEWNKSNILAEWEWSEISLIDGMESMGNQSICEMKWSKGCLLARPLH